MENDKRKSTSPWTDTMNDVDKAVLKAQLEAARSAGDGGESVGEEGAGSFGASTASAATDALNETYNG